MLEGAPRKGSAASSISGPNNTAPITVKLLPSFDAVITIFRTVLPAAAISIQVYMCDVGGADGGLSRKNYYELCNRSFSGCGSP